MVMLATGHAKYIGRVGALAVVLGVGMAVATSPGLGVAQADGTSTDSNESSSTGGVSNGGGSTSPSDDEHGQDGRHPAEQKPEQPSSATVSNTPTKETPPSQPRDPSNLDHNDSDDQEAAAAKDPGSSAEDADHASKLPATNTPDQPTEPRVLKPAPPSGLAKQDDPTVGGHNPTDALTSKAASISSLKHPPTMSKGDDSPLSESKPNAQLVADLDSPNDTGTQRFTATNARIAAVNVAPAPQADVSNPVGALLVIPSAIVDVATTVVAAILSPFVSSGPTAPAEPPLLWAVLGWVRREFFNSRPNAVADTVTTTQNVAATGNVLTNDVDADGDSLKATLVDGPQHGDVSLNADGSFTYTPDNGYQGSDTFTYRTSDASSGWHLHGLLGFFSAGHGHTDTAAVSITVDAPPVAGNDSYNTDEDTALTVAGPGVLGNDTDADGNALTAVLVNGPGHGSVGLNADGSFTYTPTANYNGTDSFTYQVADGVATSSAATVAITVTPVEDAPVANPDTYTVAEGHTLTLAAPGLLANDTDADGDTLTVDLVGTDPIPNGSSSLSKNGALTYTPNPGSVGTTTFTYKITDGTKTSTSTVTINVVDDRAPVAQPDEFTITQGHFAFGAFPGLLGNDTDPDGDTLNIDLRAPNFPRHGQLDLDPQGSFVYTPDDDFLGDDTFSYRATDGTKTSDPVTVTFHVVANHAPIGQPDSYTVKHDTVLSVSPGSDSVLANDTDQDGDNINQLALVQDTTHGHLSLGTGSSGPPGGFEYTPNQGFTGVDTFTYRPSDGALSGDPVTVTITVTDAAPIGQPDSYTVKHDTVLSIFAPGPLVNDTDADDDPVRFLQVVDNPKNGSLTISDGQNSPAGGFEYTPKAGFTGTDSFTYRPFDGALTGVPTTVTISVT
jgi:VCBS repeat-containing protein